MANLIKGTKMTTKPKGKEQKDDEDNEPDIQEQSANIQEYQYAPPPPTSVKKYKQVQMVQRFPDNVVEDYDNRAKKHEIKQAFSFQSKRSACEIKNRNKTNLQCLQIEATPQVVTVEEDKDLDEVIVDKDDKNQFNMGNLAHDYRNVILGEDTQELLRFMLNQNTTALIQNFNRVVLPLIQQLVQQQTNAHVVQTPRKNIQNPQQLEKKEAQLEKKTERQAVQEQKKQQKNTTIENTQQNQNRQIQQQQNFNQRPIKQEEEPLGHDQQDNDNAHKIKLLQQQQRERQKELLKRKKKGYAQQIEEIINWGQKETYQKSIFDEFNGLDYCRRQSAIHIIDSFDQVSIKNAYFELFGFNLEALIIFQKEDVFTLVYLNLVSEQQVSLSKYTARLQNIQMLMVQQITTHLDLKLIEKNMECVFNRNNVRFFKDHQFIVGQKESDLQAVQAKSIALIFEGVESPNDLKFQLSRLHCFRELEIKTHPADILIASYNEGLEFIIIMDFPQVQAFHFLDYFEKFDNFRELRIFQGSYILEMLKKIVALHFSTFHEDYHQDKIYWMTHAKINANLDHLEKENIPILTDLYRVVDHIGRNAEQDDEQ